jgi:hypothetical protein
VKYLAIVVCIAGCAGEKPVSPDVPVARTIEVVSGGGKIAIYGTVLPDPLVVKVKDQFGNGLSGVLVTFAVTNTVTLDRYTVTTGSGGSAQVTFSFGDYAGVDTVTATATGVATPVIFIETANPGIAATLTVVSGNNQSSTAGAQLANDLVVLVTDVVGNPTPRADVVWTATKGQPSFTKNATGVDGKARLQFSPAAGANVVNVSVDHTSLVTAFAATGN